MRDHQPIPPTAVHPRTSVHPRTTVLAGMILAAALSRLLPHPPNFAPITAIALFGAAHFDRKWKAFLVPLLALILSDLGLEILHRLHLSRDWGIHPLMPVTYGTFALITLVGLTLRSRVRVPPLALAVLASSLLLFVVTNLAVWVSASERVLPGGYPRTLAGLIECYTMALPFFPATVLGDMTYSAILFGGFALAARRFPVLRDAAPSPS